MDFKILSQAPILKIYDSSYGYGYIYRGNVNNSSAICIEDGGLSKETLNILFEVLEDEKILKDCAFKSDNSLPYSIFYNSGQVISKIKKFLLENSFSQNKLEKNSFFEENSIINDVFPIDREYRLSEGVSTYIQNSIRGIWECSKIKGNLYGISVFKSINENYIFFILRARLTEDKKGDNFLSWFYKIFPKANISKSFQEGKELELSFYLSKSYLNEVEDLSFPKFPQDKIDGLQVVYFDKTKNIDSGNFAIFKHAVIECGAAMNCQILEDSIYIEVPCSYQNSGIYGRAFESRLAYIVKELDKISILSSTRRLAERRPLSMYEAPKKANIQILSYIPEKLAFVRKISSISEKELPFLFEENSKKNI